MKDNFTHIKTENIYILKFHEGDGGGSMACYLNPLVPASFFVCWGVCFPHLPKFFTVSVIIRKLVMVKLNINKGQNN